jgi:IS605 OrfB family transposase
MATLTYVKGLPTATDELNPIGFTEFEMFLTNYSQIFHKAAGETVNQLLSETDFDKKEWNTYLQTTYGINKRHANGVIHFAVGAYQSAKSCRENHIKTLTFKLKSAEKWVKNKSKLLKDGNKFYRKKNWQKSKTGLKLPLSCSVKYRHTNWQSLRFQIHHKKRYIHRLKQQIEHLKTKLIQVKIPRSQCYVVGSSDESYGNQVCQWDGQILTFRVPYCLEEKFGRKVSVNLGCFERNINRMPEKGRTSHDSGVSPESVSSAKTWHFFYKYGHWNVGVQFTPCKVTPVSRSIDYGCIGLDINPSEIGYAYVDNQGNLKEQGQFKLIQGLRSEKMDAQLTEVCLKIAQGASENACPVVVEKLDFSQKKSQLREKGGSKYARMLSGWAYARFLELLTSILTNRGIKLHHVNPAYSSVIGCVKYQRMYGISDAVAAAYVLARRGMKLSERIKPHSLTAYLDVKSRKHVWSGWNQLNKLLKKSISSRHDYYGISNWNLQAKEWSREEKVTSLSNPEPNQAHRHL